jgi:hypothetical protein
VAPKKNVRWDVCTLSAFHRGKASRVIEGPIPCQGFVICCFPSHVSHHRYVYERNLWPAQFASHCSSVSSVTFPALLCGSFVVRLTTTMAVSARFDLCRRNKGQKLSRTLIGEAVVLTQVNNLTLKLFTTPIFDKYIKPLEKMSRLRWGNRRWITEHICSMSSAT